MHLRIIPYIIVLMLFLVIFDGNKDENISLGAPKGQ